MHIQLFAKPKAQGGRSGGGGRKEKAGNTYTLKHLRYTNTNTQQQGGHKWALKWRPAARVAGNGATKMSWPKWHLPKVFPFALLELELGLGLVLGKSYSR